MPGTGKTVAIVEDDAGLHQAFARVLKAAGHESRIFDSAEKLLAAGDIPGLDCYVLDVRLPGRSGIELAHALKEQGSSVPMILITAHDGIPVRSAAERCGATVLIKPFAGRKLLEAIETVVAAPRATGPRP